MNKPPFSYEEAVKAATISSQIEGYEPTTDKEILKQASILVKKILKTSALEGQLPDAETVKIITDKITRSINNNT